MSKLWKLIKKDWQTTLCYVMIGFMIGSTVPSLITAVIVTILIIAFIQLILYFKFLG